MYLAGLDLAGKDKNLSVIALYDTRTKQYILKEVYTDEHILNVLKQFSPRIIAIDAPLTQPLQKNNAFREAERELIRRGFRPLPLNIDSMKILVERGMKIKNKILRVLPECEIIECFASASLKLMHLNKAELEIKFNKKLNKDEIDAIACANTAYFYKMGHYEEVGDPKEGTIILPKL
ncbi:MAG: DUF429 domain-containing protein [Candidatus Nanohaloarchaeota archaeon]|nr:DUF429 domain-containing protein [Candidatus Nanohaloarchaeota archaeon]